MMATGLAAKDPPQQQHPVRPGAQMSPGVRSSPRIKKSLLFDSSTLLPKIDISKARFSSSSALSSSLASSSSSSSATSMLESTKREAQKNAANTTTTTPAEEQSFFYEALDEPSNNTSMTSNTSAVSLSLKQQPQPQPQQTLLQPVFLREERMEELITPRSRALSVSPPSPPRNNTINRIHNNSATHHTKHYTDNNTVVSSATASSSSSSSSSSSLVAAAAAEIDAGSNLVHAMEQFVSQNNQELNDERIKTIVAFDALRTDFTQQLNKVCQEVNTMIETKYSQVLNLLDQGRAQADEKISAVTLNNTESSAEIKQDLEKRSTELKARLEGFDRETADKMTSLAKTLDVFTGSLDQQVKQRERKEDCLSHTSSAIMERMVMIEKFINHQSTDFNTIQRELKKLSDEKDAKTVNAVSSLLKKRKRLQKSVTNKDDNIEDDDDEEGDNQDDGSENNMNSGNRKKSNRQISNSGNYSGKDLARDSVWIVANVAAAGLAFFNMP